MIPKKPIKVFLLATILTFISCSDDINKIENPNKSIIKESQESPELASRFGSNLYYTAPPRDIEKIPFQGTTSAELNRLISQNSRNGAIIQIPENTYTWTPINLKSNIHLEIASGTTIIPQNSRGSLFNIGTSKNGHRLENVSIYGQGGKFTVEMCDSRFTLQHASVARIGRVDNFKLANFHIKDSRSILNSILMSHVSGAPESRPGGQNGVIENISQVGAHTGYGLVQAYNCKTVLFRKLDCDGGITLRLETDDRSMKSDLINNSGKIGGVDDIFADYINNTNGLSSLMLSPHFVQNGTVTARRVSSTSSGFTIRYDGGGVSVFDLQNQFQVDRNTDTTEEINRQRTNFMNFVRAQFQGFNGVAFKGNAFLRNNGTQWAVTLSPQILNHSNRSVFITNQIGNLKAGTFLSAKANIVTANYGTKAKLKQNQLKFVPCDEWDEMTDPGLSFGLFRGFEYEGPSAGLSTGGFIEITNQRFRGFPNGFIQNVDSSTDPVCNNNPNTIRRISGVFPSCN